MPHHVSADGTGHRPPMPAAGMPPRSYEDRRAAPGGLPIRTPEPVPPPPSAVISAANLDRLRAFTETVLSLHRVLTDRFIPMCSCGSPARHCPIVKAEHDVLGIAMPFEFGPLARPLYYEV